MALAGDKAWLDGMSDTAQNIDYEAMRKEPRLRCLKGAKILVNPQHPAVDCLIRD